MRNITFVLAAIAIVTGCSLKVATKQSARDTARNLIEVNKVTDVARRVFIMRAVLSDGTIYGGGGTAFLLETESGPVIATNAHICQMGAQETGEIAPFFMIEQGRTRYLTRIIVIADNTDLCLLEAPVDLTNEVSGFVISQNEAAPEEHVTVFGHPFLRPLTKSEGLVINYIIQPLNGMNADDGYFRYARIDFMVQPGNSGSPTLNDAGQVVGVVFAYEVDTKNGLFIPVTDLKFLILANKKGIEGAQRDNN